MPPALTLTITRRKYGELEDLSHYYSNSRHGFFGLIHSLLIIPDAPTKQTPKSDLLLGVEHGL